MYRGGDLILRLSTTLLHTLLVLIGSPSRLLQFWCRFIPGGKRPAFCLHVTLFTAGLFTAWGCTRPRVVGRGRGVLTMTSFPRWCGKRRGNDWGFVVAHVGGNDWGFVAAHTQGWCSIADVPSSPVQRGQRRGRDEETEPPMVALVLSTRRLAMWTRCRGWSELGPELISCSLRLLRNSSCISPMATELPSREL